MEEDRFQPDQKREMPKMKNPRAINTDDSSKVSESSKCFRCGEVGHHQMECANDPVCYKCKKSGHMAAECGGSFSKKMKMFGFGFPNKGLYSFELLEKDSSVNFSGLVIVQEGEATEDKLTRELKHLVREDWNFQLKQITDNEYRVAFPDQNSIDTFSKMTGIHLALYGLKVKIIKTNVDPAASSVLQSAWVRISGIPSFAKKEEWVVNEIASLVGEPT
jgi:hypothetical protein